MRRLSLAFCVGIAACAPKSDPDGGSFRAVAAPIYSNAVFDLARIEGQWHQVAAFAGPTATACRSGEAVFSPKAGGMQASYDLCLSGQTVEGAGVVNLTGPGRFAVSGSGGTAQDWWVLWVDEGYRTLVIGTPSGAFGFILNRGKALPSDRLAAAREVLDFNGYDVGRLTSYGN